MAERVEALGGHRVRNCESINEKKLEVAVEKVGKLITLISEGRPVLEPGALNFACLSLTYPLEKISPGGHGEHQKIGSRYRNNHGGTKRRCRIAIHGAPCAKEIEEREV